MGINSESLQYTEVPSVSKQPSKISQKQQAMPAARDAQRVMAMTPLFWEKVVLGGPPARKS